MWVLKCSRHTLVLLLFMAVHSSAWRLGKVGMMSITPSRGLQHAVAGIKSWRRLHANGRERDNMEKQVDYHDGNRRNGHVGKGKGKSRAQGEDHSNRYYSQYARQLQEHQQFQLHPYPPYVPYCGQYGQQQQQQPHLQHQWGMPMPMPPSTAMKGMVPKEFYILPHIPPHEDVEKLAAKYLKTFDRFEQHQLVGLGTLRSFDQARQFVDEFYRNRSKSQHSSNVHAAENEPKYVILDSGCGRGMSTIMLAKMFPEYPVIGIDRSKARLVKSPYFSASHTQSAGQRQEFDAEEEEEEDDDDFDQEEEEIDDDREEETEESSMNELHKNRRRPREIPPKPENALLIQAELVAFWLIVSRRSDWTVKSHYILHPNPYAKKSLLRKRWHAQPSFASLMAMGGELVMRSNWRTYLEEMEVAIRVARSMFTKDPAKVKNVTIESYPNSNLSDQSQQIQQPVAPMVVDPMTHFEKKYMTIGVPLYQLTTNLGIRSPKDRNLFLNGLKLFGGDSTGSTLTDQEATELVRVYRNFLLS